ncbi:MAG: dihydrodipicolinate synthase family protein [Thermoprotei archaeon]
MAGKPIFYGVISPFITPFKEDLTIDTEAAKWLARYQVEKGVHGIFPNSTTGEFVHLKKKESIEITKIVLEEVGSKVWVLPGISTNCTEHSIELGRVFRDMGVNGVIVTPPFFFKIPRDKLKMHFAKIAERVDIPIIVYNIPAATGINIPVDLYVELAGEYSNIVGAKVTYDSYTYFRRLIYEVKVVRKDFAVLTGMDDLLLPVLMMGGDGGIMALANIAPQIHRAVYDAWISSNITKALEEYRRLLKLVRIYDVASSFPTAVKTALKVLGTPVKPYVRPPLTTEPPEVEEKIRRILEEVGVSL